MTGMTTGYFSLPDGGPDETVQDAVVAAMQQGRTAALRGRA